MEHISNETVLRRADTDREIANLVKHRMTIRDIFLEDRNTILYEILMGKFEDRRGLDRKQHSWIRDIRNWCNTYIVFMLLNEKKTHNRSHAVKRMEL